MKLEGGCHCGAVRFAITVEPPVELLDCNCSICAKSGLQHLIVRHEDFTLLGDAEALQSYRFGTLAANHLFCRICGIRSFYQPRSHPEAWSVNFRCLDPGHGIEPGVRAFDGRNWEQARAALGHDPKSS
ncbi:MAG: GFA family protein [Novosphingobium sp.]